MVNYHQCGSPDWCQIRVSTYFTLKVVPWLKISTIINSNTINETNIDVLISYIVSNRILVKKVVMLIILSVLIKNIVLAINLTWVLLILISINLSVLLLVFK